MPDRLFKALHASECKCNGNEIGLEQRLKLGREV